MKRITLEIQYADGRTEMRQFEDGTYVIGRDSGDIVLNNTIVSGRHGELKVNGTQAIYTDQGSTNGTFTADGARITAPLQLTPGTVLRMGECKIVVKAIHQPAAKTMLQPAAKVGGLAQAKTVLGQPAVVLPPRASSQPAPAVAPVVMPAAASTAAASAAAVAAPAGQSYGAAPVQPSAAAVAVTEPAPAPYAIEPAAAAPSQSNVGGGATVGGGSSVGSSASVGGGYTASSDASTDGSYSYEADLGTIINAPMQDKGWIVKCLVIGLMTLIPIAGALNMMGWMIAIFRNRRQGNEELPPASLAYIGDGVKILLAFLPVVGVYIVVNIVLGILTFLLPFLFFLAPLANLVIGLGLFVATPAILYLTVEKGVTFASARIGQIMAFAKANSKAYVNLLIAFFVTSLVGGAGSIVLIGSLITIPFSSAMQAAILSEIKE